MIIFKCPTCSSELKIKDEYAGKSGTCKRCNGIIKVPAVMPESTFEQKPTQLPSQISAAEKQHSQHQQVVQQIVYLQAPRLNTARLFVMVISAIGMASTFLPWISAPFIGSINGTGTDGWGDGWISFVTFLFCALLALSGDRNQKMPELSKFLIILLSAAAILMFVWKYSTIRDSISSGARENLFMKAVQIGFGLYLVGVCGFLNIVTLMMFNKEPKQ